MTIPPDERDKQLAEKLKDEWPGILAWGVEGCLEWQRDGLNPPPAVVEATEAYLTEEDGVGRFIAERCEWHPMALVELKRLYEEYAKYCGTTGEQALSQKSFSQKLETQRGLMKSQDSKSRRVLFQGIRLRTTEDEEETMFGGSAPVFER